jgi:ABC-type multidrug transport system fused ATPase/permease subunit
MDAPILILDEPTSNLDARTERSLIGAIERLMACRTTFIVAHRHSTIRHAGQVMLLEGGRVRRLRSTADLAAAPPAQLTAKPVVAVGVTP